jgi:nucleotide-binding universal stress UspA family protein
MKLLHLKVVLVAVDHDENAVHTLRGASELARSAGASLHVVHVTPPEGTRAVSHCVQAVRIPTYSPYSSALDCQPARYHSISSPANHHT